MANKFDRHLGAMLRHAGELWSTDCGTDFHAIFESTIEAADGHLQEQANIIALWSVVADFDRKTTTLTAPDEKTFRVHDVYRVDDGKMGRVLLVEDKR